MFFNIGQSEAAAKRYGLAYEAFQEYLARGGDEISTDRQSLVQSELTRLEGLIGSLEIDAPPGTTVNIDGFERGATPFPGNLKVSVAVIHTVTLHLNGTRIFSKKVKISRGETVRLDVAKTLQESQTHTPSSSEAATSTSAKLPPSSIANDKQQALRRLGISLMGIGAAAVVAGAVTGSVVLSKYNRLKEACPQKKYCAEEEKHLQESAAPLATATNVLLPLGVTVAIAGTVLTFINKKRGNSHKDAALFEVTPYATPEQGGVVIKGVVF